MYLWIEATNVFGLSLRHKAAPFTYEQRESLKNISHLSKACASKRV
jgi:hypothetical protein